MLTNQPMLYEQNRTYIYLNLSIKQLIVYNINIKQSHNINVHVHETPSLYGELERLPLTEIRKISMVSYWIKLCMKNEPNGDTLAPFN